MTNFDFELKGGGISAAILGVFLPSDYGDAPASYGDAGHYIRQPFVGGLPGTTKVYDPVSTAFTSFATVSDAPTTYLGLLAPDADPGSQNTGANATTARGDDINKTADEDGIAAFPPLTPSTTSYAVLATAYNTATQAATLWGWVDFNGNGQFSPTEAASVVVPAGASLASYRLNWSGVTVSPAAGTTVYARFRLTTGTLTDIPATPQDERAQGGAADGEVEDYALTVQKLAPDACAFRAVAWTHNDPARPRGASYLSPLVTDGSAADEVFGANLTGTVDNSMLRVTFAGVPVDFAQAQQLNSYVEYQFTPAADFYFAGLVYGNSNSSGNHAFYATWVLHNVTSGADLQTVTPGSNPLTFNGAYQEYLLPATSPAPLLTAGSTYRIRFYLYNPSQQTGLPYDDLIVRGYAVDLGDAPKDMSSIDASLSNAYPTLLTDNGARHCMDTAKRLGALVDNEPDGQPNLAANGDDTRNLNDADGVAFNPSLGITTQPVILAGVANNLIVTASVAGFLSVWIDYNQNGTFTDAGEQLYNDLAVAAGANSLNFTAPNTAPHGATYMRFRYSTQRGVANTVTGQAPDGEVEDYQVEVALPTPTTCDADLVNGSFETPGANLIFEWLVPGWGFRATDPASGSGFDQRHIIEIWSNGQEGVPAYEGNQFAEINGWVAGSLYQDMVTTPGQTMLWQFAHRGRWGTDVMALKIGPPGATVEQTRATDGNTAWTLYKGSYTVPAGQTITRFEFQAVSSTGGNPGVGNFIDTVHFALPCDFGDAPISYGTTKIANGANHQIGNLLRLGTVAPDAEGTGFASSSADGDDLNTLADEDALSRPLPVLDSIVGSYALPSLQVINSTGSPAYLYGWVDFDRNGVFSAAESVSTTVAATPVTQTLNLTWPGRSGAVAGQSFLRLRVSPQAGLAAVGPGSVGEVEDYPLTIVTGGSVVVAKRAVGGNDRFPFTSTLPTAPSFALVTANGAVTQTFAGVAAGVYAISETVSAGWVQTGATCTNGTPSSFTVTAGATVTCTFTNTRLGQINILQRTVGGDGSFPFTSTVAAANSFTVTTLGGRGANSLTGLLPGTYAVDDTTLVGWDLTGATCDNGNVPGAITLGAGVNVSCTFTNTKRGSLTVAKKTVGGDGVFTYTIPTLPTIVLTTTNGTGSQNLPNLLPGTYSLTETMSAGWRLDTALCSDGSPLNSIAIAPGEDVTCTFQNTRLDTIVVFNLAIGGDDSFTFTSTIPTAATFGITTTGGMGYATFNNLPPGSYSISETVPAGWELASVACSGGMNPANLTLTAGQTVVCTFGNEKDDTIIVEKRTVGGDGTFAFTSTIPAAASFILTTTNGVTRTSFTVAPGATYSIGERVPAGWDLTGAVCDNGNSPASVYVSAGETITCVFTDTQRSTLNIYNLAFGGDAVFPFSSTLNPATFALTTTGGLALRTFTALLPGTYALTETAPAGWDLADKLCSNGADPASVTLAPGEQVNCIFSNFARGTLTVIKQADGGDDVFAFTSTTLSPTSFVLTTTGGVAQRVFPDLVAGFYDLTEVVPAGWDLGSATCDNGDALSDILILPGEQVTCTFVNVKLASLTVVKQAVGGDGAFLMASTTLSPTVFTLTTSGGIAQRIFYPLPPGTFDVSESVPAGWDLTDATCTNGDAPDSVTLSAGDVVTCTLENTRRGAVVVVKQAVGSNGIFNFTSQTLSPAFFSLATVTGTAQASFTDLLPGVYDVTETVPAGWELVTSACSNGSSVGNLVVTPGASVTCTFTNTQPGSLTVVKNTVGDDGSFLFASQALGTFTVTTASGTAQRVFTNLLAGIYDLSESVPAGWDLTSAICSDGSSPAAVDVSPGENVTCTFQNTRRGSINIVKYTQGNDVTFAFTSPTLGNFDLTTVNGTANRAFLDVAPGRHAVTETVPSGWELDLSICSDGSSPAAIDLVPGQGITCVFFATQQASLTIVKNAAGSDGVFDFRSVQLGSFALSTTGGAASRTFSGLTPGTFAITESVPAGWMLDGIQCQENGVQNSTVSVQDAAANIRVDVGETVTCTFSNSILGGLTVEKKTVGGDGVFDFSSPQLGAFALSTTGGAANRTFSSLAPGTFAITEIVPAGWVQTGATCSNGSSPASVSVGAGESVVCTFTNTKLGSITFVKKSEGGNGIFSFSSPQLGNYRLTTANQMAQRTFTNLTPGTYSASETPTMGWDLVSATCSDGSSPTNINLAAGENVTCTFRNIKRSALTVVKSSIGGDAAFPFASQTLGSFELATVGGTAQHTFYNLLASTYDLSENTPAGWTLTGANCSDGSNPASIGVAAGEEVTCTFTNAKQGSLTVVKQATGSDTVFSFVSTALGNFDLTTVNGTASRTFANLNSGVYDLSEIVPADWRQENATCSDGSTLPAVDVAAGEDVTCTFTNSQLDTILIVKLTIGGDTAFPFASQALGSFVMTTTDNYTVQVFSGLTSGVYDMAESPVAGWTQAETDPQCSNGDPASAISLTAGETVVCVFVALKQDTIVIEKHTVGGDGTFVFNSDLPNAGNFALATLNGRASRAFDSLLPGTYSIREQPAQGWTQTGVNCSDGSDPSSIDLAPGATVRCIFTDTKLSTLTVVKQATGGNGAFTFSGSLGSFSLATAGGAAQRAFANLLPGSYRISETVPAGWSLTRSGCLDGSNPASTTLRAGREMTCTFANTRLGSLTVVVDAVDGNGTFEFTSQALGDFAVKTTGGQGQETFANLAPGVYDLNDVVTAGWDPGAATCSNGSNPASVRIDAGEMVTCIFENSAHGSALYLPYVARNSRGSSTLYLPYMVGK